MKRSLISFSMAFVLLAAGSAQAAANTSQPLMRGLDGARYLPYKPSVVRETQRKLEEKQLYSGKIDGVLGRQTMHATADFQHRHGIHASGVPSPRTRKALAIG